jgi:hypothetical protein
MKPKHRCIRKTEELRLVIFFEFRYAFSDITNQGRRHPAAVAYQAVHATVGLQNTHGEDIIMEDSPMKKLAPGIIAVFPLFMVAIGTAAASQELTVSAAISL